MKRFLFILVISVNYCWPVSSQSFELDTSFNVTYNFWSSSNDLHPFISNVIESPTKDLYVSGNIYYSPDFEQGLTLLKFDSTGNQDFSFLPNIGIRQPLHLLLFERDTIYSIGSPLSDTYFYKYDLYGNEYNEIWNQNMNAQIWWNWSSDALLLNDGKCLLSGSFISNIFNLSGIDLLRINIDGTVDTSFNTGNLFDECSNLYKMKFYDQNRLLLCANWYKDFGDSLYTGCIRRAHYPSFILDTTFNDPCERLFDSIEFYENGVTTLKILDNGKIILAGCMKLKGSNNHTGLVRLNSDGSIDSSFNFQNNLTFSSELNDFSINSICLSHDSTYYLIGGNFHYYQDYERHCIAKIDLDGFLDTVAFSGLGIDTISIFASVPTNQSEGIHQIIATSNSKYYIAGAIDKFNGIPTPPIFRIQPATLNSNIPGIEKPINIYPNPTRDKLHLEGITPNSSIEIYTLDGQLKERTHCVNESEILPISHFQSGLYIVRIQAGTKSSNYKIIVTK